MIKIFRILVIISTVLYLVWFFLPYIEHLYLSEEELSLTAYNGYGAILPTGPYVYYAFLVASLVIAAGLYFFKSWSRIGLIIYYVVLMICSPLWGMYIYPGLDVVFGTIFTLAHGAIIALMYLSSISNEFK